MKTKLLRRRLETLLSNSNNPLKIIEDYKLYNIEGLANIDENLSNGGTIGGFPQEPAVESPGNCRGSAGRPSPG